MSREIAALLHLIAPLFEADPSPAGADCAAHLRAHSQHVPPPNPVARPPLADAVAAVLDDRPVPGIAILRAALPWLDWHHSGLEDGRIRPGIATRMLTVELIGPDGMIPHPHIRAGLFFQAAGVDYATRRHAAEETFVMLAGRAAWSVRDGPLAGKHAGALIHHPSMTPHRTVTRDRAFLAAWRWSGDIGWDGYSLTG